MSYQWLYRWLRHHPEVAGRWVELRGNRVRVEGCTFRVNAPGASREFKGEFLLDRYEIEERKMLRQHLDPTLPVIELGGGIGVLACLTNKRVLHPDQHVVVEANPALIPLIERNRSLNSASFQIWNVAYSAQRHEEIFRVRSIYTISAARDILAVRGAAQADAEDVEIAVPAASLAALLAETGYSRCTLICDIEGSEYPLIDNEIACLAEHVVLFMVEFHAMPSGDQTGRTIVRLEAQGFQQIGSSKGVYVFRNAALTGTSHAA